MTLTQAVEAAPATPKSGTDTTIEAVALDVRQRVSALARTSRLLVACDYDGALAPIESGQRSPLPEAVRALRDLAELPGTVCAVVSARPLRDLAALSRLPSEVRLVGAHGTEFDTDLTIDPNATASDAAATDKSTALELLREQVDATALLYIGGGDGEEPVFMNLNTGADAGVRVGTEPTVAAHSVSDTPAAAGLLALLATERRSWVFGERPTPIERMSMLSNQASVALVGPDARLLWFCHPEPDSNALFAEVLGGRQAGVFAIAPAHGGLPLGQRYLPGTMTVRTRWSRLEVTDYLAHDTEPGRTDLIRVIGGVTPATIEFAPRPDFGRAPIRITVEPEGLRIQGADFPMVLRSPGVEWHVDHDGTDDVARATVHPRSERPVVLELRCGTDSLAAEGRTEGERQETATRHWSHWLDTLELPATEKSLAARSALTLRGLCTPTGGVMAAATTSLPEEIGGVRNWDYRYCWLRDGALTVQALVTLGSNAEAEAFLDWVHGVVDSLPSPELLRPLYSLRGTDLGPEETIDSLSGYAGSRPVRIGNLADHQVQLDVFGPVVELIGHLSEARGRLADRDWDLVRAMAEAVARRWHEPDHGIWEERDEPRQRVYSKVMCWVTLDRALKFAETYGRTADDGWRALREEIAAEVLDKGWNETAQAYTTAYDGTDLDAASLHIGLSGLIDPADERFQATVTAIEAELRSGPTVYRYHRDDGLPGGEGGFHLCTTWLIEAYLLTGRRAEAEELFKHLVDAAGPTGLIPEEFDPVTERALGNHPQAYSHLGLIRCARLLDGHH
ncbi:trehalase-like domain-containing protein [Nocardiopsis sp. MG754419]|uniref:trehalase-like domain-containing protein n=1 Tax=Nocardiopsis sp. MG754419 TaxID=2259865 RepID=UPI001BA9F7E2|nr:trehalase-like domain-containing protein [Nocardiopsis sp. MG754419]MBR8740918.1 glycoside hydrolase family 15 protein [Nocardiopsis sp. MG754419]